jgi:hypothetical protein
MGFKLTAGAKAMNYLTVTPPRVPPQAPLYTGVVPIVVAEDGNTIIDQHGCPWYWDAGREAYVRVCRQGDEWVIDVWTFAADGSFSQVFTLTPGTRIFTGQVTPP